MSRFTPIQLTVLLMLLLAPSAVTAQSEGFWEALRSEVHVALQPRTAGSGEHFDEGVRNDVREHTRNNIRLNAGEGAGSGAVFDHEHILADGLPPVKCLTPHLITATVHHPDHEISAEIREMFELAAMEIQNTEFYLSPSGRFRLEFSRIGTHAVPLADTNGNGIPDYVERAAIYADSSYAHQVTRLGFTDPVNPLIPYRIGFMNMGSYGFTQSAGATTYIMIHNSFQGFPPNDDPDGNALGAMKVTIAHEFKHAIQYADSRWQGETGRVEWVEMDATMMEEITFDPVNDYYNYISGCYTSGGQRFCSVFGDPNLSTPGSYDHVTWSLYYAEAIGIDFWVDVWRRIRQNPAGSQMFQVMTSELAARGRQFNTEFVRNHMWHFASGTNARNGYGFKEAAAYPTPKRTFHGVIVDSLRVLPEQTSPRAAQYVTIDDAINVVGQMGFDFSFAGSVAGLGVIAYMNNGEIHEFIETGLRNTTPSGFFRMGTTINWEDVSRVGVILANPSDFNQTLRYRAIARELPAIPTLYPNYPNPFNPSTTISFALPAASNVTVQVYDAQGRLVSDLFRGNLSRGFHEINFDGRGLSSGVYLYRVSTGWEVRTGKMLLVK